MKVLESSLNETKMGGILFRLSHLNRCFSFLFALKVTALALIAPPLTNWMNWAGIYIYIYILQMQLHTSSLHLLL